MDFGQNNKYMKPQKTLFVVWSFSLYVALHGFVSQSTEPVVEYPNYWSSEREYIYHVLYSDSDGQKITTEKVTMKPTGKIWDADPKQTLMNFQLDSISADWSKISATPLNGKQRNWMTNYEEGVLQTPKKVWMHPLRQNQYILTELAPFPEIILPIKKDTSWNTTLWIYKAFGTFEGTVECVYTLSQQEKREYDFGELNCWKVVAIGTHDKLGQNTATYYFNEEYGFTEMNYHFFNNQKIEIKLTRLIK